MYKDIIKNTDVFDLQIPITSVPNPTEEDYEIGFVYRYFLRKANDENSFIYEVDEGTYETYTQKKFWISYRLKWRISGPTQTTYKLNDEINDIGVLEANKRSSAAASSLLKNISLYLPNLLQFYKG